MTTVPMDFRGDPATLGQKESTSAGEQARRIVNKLQIVVGRYEEWVCQHSNFARHVETLLYIAPNLMPKKIGNAEITTELGYSVVGLLRLYHDYVLYKSKHPVDFVVGSWNERVNRFARIPLSLISHVQVAAEAIAEYRGGDVAKWRMIVWIEVVKCACKLVLLFNNKESMLLGGGKYKSIEIGFFPRNIKPSSGALGSRTGKSFGKPQNIQAPAVAPTNKGATQITFEAPACRVESQKSKTFIAGELIHAVRPVLYAILRYRNPKDSSSWTPLSFSLLLEALSLFMTSQSVQAFTAPSSHLDCKRAESELSSRKMLLLLYLLRDPVYIKLTKPAAEKACSVTDAIPLLGKLFRYGIMHSLNYYHQYHLYTSGS